MSNATSLIDSDNVESKRVSEFASSLRINPKDPLGVPAILNYDSFKKGSDPLSDRSLLFLLANTEGTNS